MPRDMDNMHGAIFCDPNFTSNFLTVDSTKLQTVLDACKDNLDALHFREHITRERQLYDPIRKVFNTIKQAVGGVSDSENYPTFIDVSAEPISSSRRKFTGLKPDLALFDGSIRRWETMVMPIEIKRQATYLKTGMKQLTRYARAVFAHQLHRRHLYALAICGWDATFVRFDRSGVLYSKPVDIRSEEFREAFAGLLMLDDATFGYDTAFTMQIRHDGGLEYYVDLPACAFEAEGDSNIPEDEDEDEDEDNSPTDAARPTDVPNAPLQIQTRRLKVVERLFHHEDIRGRATIVVRLRKVIRPGYSDEPEKPRRYIKTNSKAARGQQSTGEVLDTRDYVLKLMWRDAGQQVEGEAVARLVGVYGVGQHMWHGDVLKPCSLPSCEFLKVGSCEGCLDMTPNRDQVLATKNMTDLNIEIPEEIEGDEETEYKEVQTDEYFAAYAHRPPRIYCRLLTSTMGSPLGSAESPRQLLRAFLDAILGYWRLVNMGVLHRDISEGNVLMLREGQGYNKRQWKIPQATNIRDPELEYSEELLQAVLDRFDRDPAGMVNDFDLFTTYGETGDLFFDDSSAEAEARAGKERELKRRKLNCGAVAPALSSSKKDKRTRVERRAVEVEGTSRRVIDYRMGTPAFMSTRILHVAPGNRYQHYFTDDLESFFWLLLVCVIEHIDSPDGEPTQGAIELSHKFGGRDLYHIASSKSTILRNCCMKVDCMRWDLASCGNSWAADPAIVSVVLGLGEYFGDIFIDYSCLAQAPSEVFPAVVGIITRALAL